jgi:acylphosphatase
MRLRAGVTIKGIVQGVNYRYYTMEKALQHNVTGWMRNLANGDVEGCFEGEEGDVTALVDWCRIGPSRARVDEVVVESEPFKGEFTEFRVRH